MTRVSEKADPDHVDAGDGLPRMRDRTGPANRATPVGSASGLVGCGRSGLREGPGVAPGTWGWGAARALRGALPDGIDSGAARPSPGWDRPKQQASRLIVPLV